MTLLFSFFGVIVLVVIVLGVLFGYALYRTSKSSKSATSDLEQQLKEAISKARRIKFKSEADINRLRIGANEAIKLVFGNFVTDVPSNELIDNFDQIVEKHRDKVDEQNLAKTIKVVEAYKQQIQVKQTEREYAEQLENKYQNLLDQLKASKLQQRKSQKLQYHEQKLAGMQDNMDSQKQLIEQDLSYDMVKGDVEQKLAYLDALQELQDSFDTQSEFDPQLYKKEMDKIISQG